jgi:hypothetical protein
MKKNIILTLLLTTLLGIAPVSTYALSLNLKGDSDSKGEVKSSILERVFGRSDVNVNSNVNANASVNASSSHKNDDNDGDHNDNRSTKAEDNFGAKVSAAAKDKPQGIFGWFVKLLKRDRIASSTPIKISSLNIVEATSTASITWRTNTLALGDIRFNTDKNSVASSTRISETGSLSLEHKITLSGLSPNTEYFFTISSRDANGNIIETKDSHFKTRAIEATVLPKILFSGTLGVESSLAHVIWVTNKPTNSKVWISTTSTVDTSVAPKALSLENSRLHELSVGGLATSTTYFYTISSVDASGNTVSAGGSFKTLAQ